MLDQEFAHRIGQLFWEKYKDFAYRRFQLCGCESGGSLLVSALQADDGYPGFMIKKAAKSYGLGNWIEGVCDPKLPVLLVDDVVGSGKTLQTQADRLRGFGLKVMGFWAIASCKHEPVADGVHNALYGPGDFARLHTEYVRKYGKEPRFAGTVV